MPTFTSSRRPFAWCRDDRGLPLAVAGVGLVASGLVHLVVWAALGGPWEGAVTWRKPILFGISAGLTAVSLGWAWACLPRRCGDSRLATATATALVAEVAIIDLQRWRGVPSHFNRATPLDAALNDVMTWLILAVTLVIGDLTLRYFLQRPRLTADLLLAARAGLVLLAVSCLLGIWTGVAGEARRKAGLPPETLGPAGVLKFPHGAALHAVQWLPCVSWAARRAGLDTAARARFVALSAAGSLLFGVYALVQTAGGRSRFDLTPVTALLIAAAIGCLALPPVGIALAACTRRRG